MALGWVEFRACVRIAFISCILVYDLYCSLHYFTSIHCPVVGSIEFTLHSTWQADASQPHAFMLLLK